MDSTPTHADLLITFSPDGGQLFSQHLTLATEGPVEGIQTGQGAGAPSQLGPSPTSHLQVTAGLPLRFPFTYRI